uniref:Uncharacterized protein n=1 Tax=Athene cunicularia TaxID=194338 RepID=A0A663LKP4_ATHCN
QTWLIQLSVPPYICLVWVYCRNPFCSQVSLRPANKSQHSIVKNKSCQTMFPLWFICVLLANGEPI